jgi:hypothetical protein
MRLIDGFQVRSKPESGADENGMAVNAPPIEPTRSGVKVELKTLYVYPDGHANLTFADGTNWPLADEYEVVQWLTGKLLRPMQMQARRKAEASA